MRSQHRRGYRGGLGLLLVFDAFNVLHGSGSGEDLRFLIYIREAILFYGCDGVRPHPDDYRGNCDPRDGVPDPERCPRAL